ncbi:hypothetical protein P3X46_004304 [Hevea brasiliensis]|uniref:Glutaredoxin domain-containing protein n=1 Tax=Hevea brasiliensis TaxID=3981 RepID=A0ABQ9MWB4_HEVBR|nr:uncharacterized protein At5g39865-like [Hevea brasiliensis]KAJ9184592.1 hypothetical protein P3X46_004304 [Hevea brasiliensis]
MKSMKGRFLKKLRFIPTIETLKHGLVSHFNSTDKFSHQNLQIPSVYIQEDHKINNLQEAVTGDIGVSERFTELKDEESDDLELHFRDKEKITPFTVFNDKVTAAIDNLESPVSSEITMECDEANETEHEKGIEEYPSLSHFEEKCPPEGSESVILYTTSLRSIRKTFEDCHTILFLLESFKVEFHERDVSMHLEYREELWRILGGRVIPPRLFIKGRYIGGADEVVSLHEQGKLKKLLEGIPKVLSNTPCAGCGNKRFVVCLNCNGSRKVFTDWESDEMHIIRCPECNENGLVKCKICCQ